jgi:hypothetical protein
VIHEYPAWGPGAKGCPHMTVELHEFLDSVIIPALVERVLCEQQRTAATSSCGTDGAHQEPGHQELDPNGHAYEVGNQDAAA